MQPITPQNTYNHSGGGGDGCHLRVVPPVQLQAHPNVFAFLQFSLNRGLCIFCFVKFPSHVFFCLLSGGSGFFIEVVMFPIVFKSNSLYILYIFIYFFIIFSLFFVIHFIVLMVSLWHPGDGRDVRKKQLPYNYFFTSLF